MTNHTNIETVLVTGGTGKTGRRVAALAAERGATVRVGSRSGSPPFSWEDERGWPAALRDVDAVYIAFAPDLGSPGAAETVAAFAHHAADADVERLVLLSGRGEPGAERAERLVYDVAPHATVLRAAWFAQNFSESFLLDPVREGSVVLPAGDVREPFVDVDDIAEVAVAALLDPGHAGELYEVTGPQLLTFAEAVGEIADAAGMPVAYESVPLSPYLDALRSAGLPADLVDALEHVFRDTLDGRNATLADGVQRALGRPPRRFAEYARATAAAGLWTPVVRMS